MAIELAEQAPSAGAPDAVTTALVEVTTTNAKMTELAQAARDLAAQYKDVVADVTTGKGYDQIAAIRTEIRSTARYPMQNLKDAGSKMLGTMQRQFNERATALIEEVKALEKPFQDQLDAEDTRKANEKAERDRIEAERIQRHVGALAIITGTTVQASGLDAAGIKELIDQLAELVIGEDWEEFRGQAQQAKDEALRQLNGAHVAALAEEQERAELAAERQRQAEFRAQQEARQRELDEQADRQRQQQAEQQRLMDEREAQLRQQQAQLDAQREQQERAQAERAQAVQQRINFFTELVQGLADRRHSAERLAQIMEEVHEKPINADLYDGRVEEALGARNVAIADLGELLEAAQAREAEEARQREADRIQVNLNNLATYGKLPEDASSEFIAARIQALSADEELTSAIYGERLTEAADIHVAALEFLEAAFSTAEAREQEAAAEAERQRQEIEANAAAVARMTRMQDAAPRMFAILGELVANPVYASELADAARAIINEIEGVN